MAKHLVVTNWLVTFLCSVLVNIRMDIFSPLRVTHKGGCLVTVYFHFDHPSKEFVLVCRPRCSIVHVIYQTKELIGILCKIFHSAADMSCVNILQQWTVDSLYMRLTIYPLGTLNVFL